MCILEGDTRIIRLPKPPLILQDQEIKSFTLTIFTLDISLQYTVKKWKVSVLSTYSKFNDPFRNVCNSGLLLSKKNEFSFFLQCTAASFFSLSDC